MKTVITGISLACYAVHRVGELVGNEQHTGRRELFLSSFSCVESFKSSQMLRVVLMHRGEAKAKGSERIHGVGSQEAGWRPEQARQTPLIPMPFLGSMLGEPFSL